MFNLTMASILWLLLAIILAVAEGMTVQLVAIWFALGAAAAAVAAAFPTTPLQQFILFVVVSGVLLLLTRPLVREKLQVQKQRTNVDQVIGQVGMVKEAIQNDLAAGRVAIMGLDWAARSAAGIEIPAGERVRVLAIEGVKLIVEPAGPEQ